MKFDPVLALGRSMFAGLVEATTEVLAILPETGGVRVEIARPSPFVDLALGDSICVSGCCLTIVAFDDLAMVFQAGEETLSKTTLGKLVPGAFVNCERSLALGDRIGGHLVSGHVDGGGRLAARDDTAEWSNMRFDCDWTLLRQMASKGSITVDGVSLTLVDVDQSSFGVALIPHTLEHTTLGKLEVGDIVNLETDLLAKYVQRQLETQVR